MSKDAGAGVNIVKEKYFSIDTVSSSCNMW